MTRVNKKYIKQELQNAAWKYFGDVIKKSKSEKELVQNLHKFLTESEIVMLEKRLIIPILLGRKMSYRAIGEMIDITRTTISFVKKGLKRKPRIKRKYSPNPNYREIKEVPPLPSRSGHGRWLRAKLRGQKFYYIKRKVV